MSARLAVEHATASRPRTPMAHYRLRVTRVTPLTRHLVRITFTGSDLRDFTDDGPDQRGKLFLPRLGQHRPIVPTGDDWYARWRQLPDAQRPVLRTYTVRAHRREAAEIDIDFVLHGDAGPASAWAGRARPGDHVALYGTRADYAPPAGTDWQLIAGDETALPAIGAILERLPAETPAQVFVEVGNETEHIDLTTAGQIRLTWVHRDGTPPGTGDRLASAVRAAGIPAGTGYAWVAGESAAVQAIRRHLVGPAGLDPAAVTFCGYWRLGGAVDPS